MKFSTALFSFSKVASHAESIIYLLPTKYDTTYNRYIKYMAMAKILMSKYLPEDCFKNAILEEHNLNASNTNYFFVKILSKSKIFNSSKLTVETIYTPDMKDRWSTKNVKDTLMKILFVDNCGIAIISTSKNSFGNELLEGYESEFYFNENFSFKKLSEFFWKERDNAICLSKDDEGIEFSKFAIKNSNIRTKKSSDIAQYIYNNHVNEHLNSTYLLYGPPGTGKTTLVSHLYNKHNCKVLKIDATTITKLSNDIFTFITDLLMPDFIIIDDYDRLSESDIAKLLFFFEKLKAPKHNITTIITANDPSKLDRATLRSGRIDEVIEIGLPDEEERADLVMKLIAEYKLDRALTPSVVDATNDYCHADIIGLVGKLRYLPFEQANDNLSKLMRLAQGCTVKKDIL